MLLNPQTAGVPYTEQNHLHGQWREFRKWNNAQKNEGKRCKNDFTYSGLLNTDKASVLYAYRRERDFSLKKKKKKKKKKKIKMGQKPFYSQSKL